MVVKPIFETLETEKVLGWRAFSVKDHEKVKSISGRGGSLREILQLKNNKKLYLLKNLPELSTQEAILLKKALEYYQNSNSNDNRIQADDAMEEYCQIHDIELDQTQQKYMKQLLGTIVKPAGIISEFLKDESLEEIAVIGVGKSKPIYVFDSVFGWLATNVYFSSAEEVRNISNAMAGTIGRRLTLQKPQINAMLNDGSRLNACIEPASVSGPSITIRKFRKNPFTPCNLFEMESVSLEQLAFLWMAMQADCSIMVCGNTGSGKTTLLNSLLNFVPSNERIILVEETPEINTLHKHFVKLVSVEGLDIEMQDLITNTLRMRPDRVIVGEIRDGQEAKAFMDSLLAGQGKGCTLTKWSL